jgi:bifunctional pyridoxal-dependent enzyme with beta-cystathionase and maltose regulon repressor activities
LPVNRATLSDLDYSLFRNFLSNYLDLVVESDDDTKYYLINFHLLTEKNIPTITGILFFGENPQKFFLQNARVYLNNGLDFGDPNSVRLNIACSRKTLEQIMERMKVAYDSLNQK